MAIHLPINQKQQADGRTGLLGFLATLDLPRQTPQWLTKGPTREFGQLLGQVECSLDAAGAMARFGRRTGATACGRRCFQTRGASFRREWIGATYGCASAWTAASFIAAATASRSSSNKSA